MRAKEDRQPLTDQEKGREPSMEADQEGSDIVDDDEEEDTDDESIDIPPNPENQANIERLKAENTMLKELAARREVVRKEMQEYKEKIIEMIRRLSHDSDQAETTMSEGKEQKLKLMEEIIGMLTQLDPQKPKVGNAGFEGPSGEEGSVNSQKQQRAHDQEMYPSPCGIEDKNIINE